MARPAASYSPYEEDALTPDGAGGEAGGEEHRARRPLARGHREGRNRLRRQEPALATEKKYGDFELWVDWLMSAPTAIPGSISQLPQVQIWDPANPREVKNGAEKGLGALWNNSADNPGKWPLVKADHPVGEWNTLRVRMVGPRVWIWLNGKPTVEGQVLDNYFKRGEPVLPTGAIELQTHGSRSASGTSTFARFRPLKPRRFCRSSAVVAARRAAHHPHAGPTSPP